MNPFPLRLANFIIIPDNIEAAPDPIQLITIESLAPRISTKNPFINTEIP